MIRPNRRVASLPLVLTLAGALTVGCGSEVHNDTAAPAAVDAGTSARAESLLLDLYERVAGSVEDRRAQEFLVYAAMQSHFRSCMRAAQFDYNWAPFYDLSAGQSGRTLPSTYDELPEASVEDARVHGLRVGEGMVTLRQGAIDPEAQAGYMRRATAYHRLSPEQKSAYNDRLTECEGSLPAGVEEMGLPPMLHELHAAMVDTWRKAVEAPEVRAASEGYAECMTDAGTPATDREHLLLQVENKYAGFKPSFDSQGPPPLELTNPKFAAAREFEKQAAVADARCRERAHELAMTRLLPLLERFATEHAQDIAVVQQQWAGTRAEAQRVRVSTIW